MKATVSEVIKKINKENIYNAFVNSYLAEKWCEGEEFVKDELKKRENRFIRKFKAKKYNKIREKLIPFESVINYKNKRMYVCGMYHANLNCLAVELFNMKRNERYNLYLDEFMDIVNA